MVTEVHNELLSLTGVYCKTVFFAPLHQLVYLIFVLRLVVVAYQANNCGVICQLEDPVVAVLCMAVQVICEQRVQPWTEAATPVPLWC